MVSTECYLNGFFSLSLPRSFPYFFTPLHSTSEVGLGGNWERTDLPVVGGRISASGKRRGSRRFTGGGDVRTSTVVHHQTDGS